MIHDLKPYPAYKDSGVPWLGEVPEHWEIQKLKHLTQFHNGLAFKPSDWSNTGIPIIRIQNLNGSEEFNYTTRKDLPKFLLIHSGDLLFSWSGNRGTSFGPFIWRRPFKGYLNQHIFKLDGYKLDTYYFAHLLRAVTKHIEDQTHGIIGLVHITKPELGAVCVPVAPSEEQSAIVRYLDHIDRRIRRYIRAKQKLIKLLEEQKQAIINQAVTRGLDPDVKLKPSGVEWLGEVPEHWEVRQLGRFITLQRGFDITKEQQVQGNVPVVSSGGFSSYHNQSTSTGPGVIVGRKGSVGTVHFIEGAYWAHDTTLWVKEFNGNHPKFIYYVLMNLDLKRFDTGSANPTINRNIVHPEIVAFPPTHEQFSISSYLDHKLEQNRKLIEHCLQEISLLQEYRTRLIADIVTGKLDVREAVKDLPEEIDEIEILDEELNGDEEITEKDIDCETEE